MDLSWANSGLLAAALLAIGIGSLAKGITGVSLPILAVPVLASFTSVEEAVVLMLLPGIAANGWLVAGGHGTQAVDRYPVTIARFFAPVD